jgi:bifunctional DNase/RNase
MGMVQVQIDGLAMDLVSNSPVVVLASQELGKVLPIWIGHNEAWAIAMEISGLGSKRPLTHDLFRNTIEAMGGHLERVDITELKEQTFYAVLRIVVDGKKLTIDARPSDSIALALKSDCPIFANEELFAAKPDDEEGSGGGGGEGETPPPAGDPESLKDRLRRIDPEDFGKYSL